MSSRARILGKLRATRHPFDNLPTGAERVPTVPLLDKSPQALQVRFVEELERVGCKVLQTDDSGTALQHVLSIVGEDKAVLTWDFEHIPLAGLREALQAANCEIAAPRDASVRVGITGVDAGLAATGSLLLMSGVGKARQVSLLPAVHVAILTTQQILPDLETWAAAQREKGLANFRQSSNVVLVTGPSRTADIAMELIVGMHGPGEVHVVILSA